MPGGWTSFARRTACLAVALALCLVPLDGVRRAAHGAEARLPFQNFFDLHVDGPRRHVLVSGGSGTNAVFVFGFDGRLIDRIEGLPGAADMLLEGDTMYVALSNSNAIAIVDLKKLEVVDSIDVSPYAQPLYLSKSGDIVYFTHGCDEIEGKLGSVDLDTGLLLDHGDPNVVGGCSEHAIVPNDPSTMLVWAADGHSEIQKYNVAARRPIFVERTDDYADDVQFSSDGETFYSRATKSYSSVTGIEQRRISDLGVVGNFPRDATSYAFTPDESLLFTSTYSYESNVDVHVFRTGGAAPIASMTLDDAPHNYEYEQVLMDSLAAAPSGDRVFAVVFNQFLDGESLAFRVLWPQYRYAAGAGDQTTPAAAGPYEVWSDQPRGARFSRLRGRSGGKTFPISPAGTSGYGGGISGTRLVYQLVRGRQSDLRLYDLKRRRQVSDLARLNTPGWEWHPTISGGRILFTRVRGAREQVILHSSKTGRGRVLSNVDRRTRWAMSGQVNGDFAVWVVCSRMCDVYRLNLKTGGRVRMPRTASRANYAPSVTRDGVVYYGQSGEACGSRVEILRYSEGRVTEIEDLPVGQDLFVSYADDGNGRVLFDRIVCRGKQWDVLSFRDDGNAGDARGQVVDDPAAPGDEGAGGVRLEDLVPGRPR